MAVIATTHLPYLSPVISSNLTSHPIKPVGTSSAGFILLCVGPAMDKRIGTTRIVTTRLTNIAKELA